MDMIVGDVVTGDNLFGRKEKIKELWDRIDANSILLSSPRRFGKTSLVHEMKLCPKDGWNVIYTDVEGIETPEDFVLNLIEKGKKRTWDKIKHLFASARNATEELSFSELRIKLRENLENDWQSKGKKFFEALNEEKIKTIVVLDELPIFLLNLENNKNHDYSIKIFLQWLRDIRQTYGIRFIFCGSIGIETILMKHNLGNAINDLERIKVPPFDTVTATKMIKELLVRYNINHNEDHISKILELIDVHVPYFIQLLLKEILSKTNHGEIPLTDEIISNSYDVGLLGTEGRQNFNWYFDRLSYEFEGKQYEAVLKMLDSLARQKTLSLVELENIFYDKIGRDDRPVFLNVIEKLELGFYIQDDSGMYSFHIAVLRDLWLQRRGNS